MRGELMERLIKITAEEERLLRGGKVEKALYTSGQGFHADSERLLAQGQLIAIRVHTRFAPFPEHSHDYVEIMYMCSGCTRHTINNGPPLTLQAGELLFLNQHARHSVERAGREDVGINFLVLPQFFDYALTMTSPGNVLANFLADGLRRGGGELSFLHFQAADKPPVQNLVENLLWGLVRPQRSGSRLEQATMGLLFMQLLEDLDGLSRESGGQSRPVLAALREIEENYRQADLTRLAGELHVSLPYLSHAVRSATGKTYKELLREKRLSRAAALLTETTLPIDDIIAAVGYDNTSYFYRKFRERYGVSPRQWRLETLGAPPPSPRSL